MKRELTVLVKDELAKALQLKPQKEVGAKEGGISATTITMGRIVEALQLKEYVTTGRKTKYQTGEELPFKDEVDPNKQKQEEFKHLVKVIKKAINTDKKQWQEKLKTLNEEQLKDVRRLKEIVRVELPRRQMHDLIRKTTITNVELFKQFIEKRKEEKAVLDDLELPLRDITAPILVQLHQQVVTNNLLEEFNKVKVELNLGEIPSEMFLKIEE